jgi:hypothetical protein
MGLFLALEALALGIIGKQALWLALEVASKTMPQLGCLDYADLKRRATDQHDQVQAKRLEVARDVFKPN